MIQLPSIVAQPQLEAMCRLAETTPQGHFVEIGVYQGGSAQRLYEVAIAQHRELHLFDTFNGTPNFTEGLDDHKVGDEFSSPLAPAIIATVMPVAKVHVGIYPFTHPTGFSDVAFIHCDCDQYASYRAVIDYMWPLVVTGGILLFDDYPYLAGAKRAVEETFDPKVLKKCHQRYYALKDIIGG